MDNEEMDLSVAWKLDDFLHFMGGPPEAPAALEAMCREAAAARRRQRG